MEMKKVNLNSLDSNLVPKIFLAFLSLGVTVIKPCLAQSIIVPDNSLGNEASKVTPNINNLDGIPSELIEGGAERGQNLFHSFQEFNVNEGRGAYFVVPHDTIQNILTRVTGNNPSSINGILGTIANSNFAPTKANLFLINPNGIIFGKNASLDINGSFVGTTANAVELGGEGFFSATNPQTPSELLTVSPSALLFNQINAQASIQNNSVVDLRLNRGEDNFTPKGLRVGDGKSLLLVGGDINMDAGGLSAFGGHVELGGLADAGTVGLKVDRNNLSLSFPSGIERSDVFLSNGAGVRVTAGNGGSISVNARNLEMTGESFLLAGIESELSSDDSKAGDIDINTTSAIKLNNQSNIVNQVQSEARGQGGDVNISASTLQVEGGSQLFTSTFGVDKGGNLIVDALDVQVIGTDTNGFSSSLSTFTYSTGDAGDLTIKTNTLLLRDGSEVSAVTFSKGKGGNLTVDASDVQLIESRDGFAGGSILSTGAQRNSTGDSGDLTIKTNTLLVRDGAVVTAGTFGEGNSGNLNIDAVDVQVIGTSKDGLFNSALGIAAQPSSTGDTGDLTIKTNTLLVRDGGIVSASTFGTGKGGNLTIDAVDVQVIGTGKDGFPSGLFAAELSNPSKDVGSLTIKTSTLLVRDGAQVGAGTFGASKGGNLTIDATDVQVIGTSKDGRVSSGLFASAEPNSTGDAGDLTIKTNALLVEDGAQVTAGTSGTGNGGNLIVDANTLQLKDDGNLNAQSSGTGKAGEININLKDNFNADNGQITTQAQQSSGGNINITTGKKYCSPQQQRH